jgi:hypothetical protein
MIKISLCLALAACANPLLDETTETSAVTGQSALLAGMHDIESSGFMRGWTTAADKGWITDLQYIGSNGTPPINCHTTETSAGVSIIQRLDVDGAHSFPMGDPTGYANSFSAYVSACPNIHVWIVGNEPNVTTNQNDPEVWAAPYAAAYNAVRSRVHGITGHQSDLVLMSPASPYSPFCICSMHKIIQKIVAGGGQPDGFAVHAYTQEPNGTSAMTGLVTSDESGGPDNCGLAFRRQFRIYRDWITALEAEGQRGKPVFLTEVGNVCHDGAGSPCYPNANNNYFRTMYAEIQTWNAGNPTKIRAITPYRWTANDDGSGRDFSIASRPNLQTDLIGAFNLGASTPPPTGTCDNGVPLNGTACNPSDPAAQYKCTSPGAGPTAQWTRQLCASGQSCAGDHCQASAPPATCDNGVPRNGTACNPSDPFAQYVCTSPGAGGTIQWTRQACGSGQSCSGNHCQGSLPQCGSGRFCAGNQIPGSSPCLAGAQTIFCCAPGHTIVNGACN